MAVTLRPQEPDDLPWLHGGDSEFADFGPQPPRRDPAPSGLENNGALSIDVDDAGLPGPAGDVSWHWTKQWGPSAASRCPMIGIWLRREFRGRGVGSEAQAQLARLLFAHTNTNRVEAATEVDNIGEQRALERAGFSREGRIRGSLWRNGSYRDCYLYAMLRSEARAG